MRERGRRDELELALTAATEAGDLHDLGARVLPRLQRAARASATLLYRYDEEARLQPIAGDIKTIIEHYARHYLPHDPVQSMARKLAPRPRVVLATKRVDARAYHRSAAYGEFYAAFDLEHLTCAWLTHLPYGSPGMTGLLFTRPRGAGEFDDEDQQMLARALPMLAAATARAERLRDLDLQREALDAIASGSGGPARLVLSSSGRVVWAARACERVLGAALVDLPDALRGAARRLADASLGKATLPSTLRLTLLGVAAPVDANLSLLPVASGAPLVLVELEDPAAGGAAAEALARRFGLTPAEGGVLGLLGGGLSNPEIASRLHVSVETVRTHVGRVLSKLGVRSRVEAALLVARR
jgi:DNA-binding CsgD family transcriptional regulator